MHELAGVLCNIQNVSYVRQAAGLQLKNTLVTKESDLIDSYSKRYFFIFKLMWIF